MLLFSLAAHAEWAIQVQDPWIRHIPGDRPMAGYMVVENRADRDRELVGASSPAFGSVHLHRTTGTDGAMSMEPVDSLTIKAGGRLELAPGGYHLMLMQPTQTLQVGDEVPVIIELADGGTESVVFAVKPAWQE